MATTRRKKKAAEVVDPAKALEEFFYRPEEAAVDLGAFAVPGPQDQGESEGERGVVEYLTFWLGDELYALPIAALREIVRPLEVTEVPRTPPFVVGVVTLRGTVLPVFDPRVRLNLPRSEATPAARILIVDTEEGPAGLFTDRVAGVARFDTATLEPAPSTLGSDADWVEGLLRKDGQMLIVLDYEKVLRVRAEDRA